MKKCNKCNVLIKDDTNICPLCKYILSAESNTQTEDNYPKLNPELNKHHLTSKILFTISAIAIIIVIVIDLMLNQNTFHFSIICIAAIIYAWITTLYAIKMNRNIASQTTIQAIFLFLLATVVDLVSGFKNWSLDYALPIIIIISNIILFILSIVSNKDFAKYVIYQIILTIFSLLPIILVLLHLITFPLLTLIATIVAGITFLCVFIFCNNEFKEEFKRRFHF